MAMTIEKRVSVVLGVALLETSLYCGLEPALASDCVMTLCHGEHVPENDRPGGGGGGFVVVTSTGSVSSTAPAISTVVMGTLRAK